MEDDHIPKARISSEIGESKEDNHVDNSEIDQLAPEVSNVNERTSIRDVESSCGCPANVDNDNKVQTPNEIEQPGIVPRGSRGGFTDKKNNQKDQSEGAIKLKDCNENAVII